jgi:hypothetical protein
VHYFVLLGVSFIQLKLNRVRAKQCYSISEFRLICCDNKVRVSKLIGSSIRSSGCTARVHPLPFRSRSVVDRMLLFLPRKSASYWNVITDDGG